MKDKSTRKVKNNHKKRPKTADDFKRDLINHHNRMCRNMRMRLVDSLLMSEHFARFSNGSYIDETLR